jgi:hypothetical protein
MIPKRTIILLVIFLALGGYVFYFETGPKERSNPSEETNKLLIYFDPEDVEEITLKNMNDEMVLIKLDKQWQMHSPMQALSTKSRIDSFLSVFIFPIIRIINNDPDDLTEYGLTIPKIELGLRMRGETQYKTLQLGNTAPEGFSCYAKLKGKPEVYLIGQIYENKLNVKPDFFIGSP